MPDFGTLTDWLLLAILYIHSSRITRLAKRIRQLERKGLA